MKKKSPEPNDGQVKTGLTGFDQGEFMRSVHISGLAEHAEALSKDEFFTLAWRKFFESTAKIASSLGDED